MKENRLSSLPGLVVIGGLLTGVLALVIAVATLLSGDLNDAILALVPAALAFGLLANAFYRS